MRPLLPLWAAATLAVNLAVIAVPTAAYPFRRAAEELRAAFTPKDLLLDFAAYPGGAYLGFFDTPGVPRIAVDKLYFADRDPHRLLRGPPGAIDGTLANGRPRGRLRSAGSADVGRTLGPACCEGECPRTGSSGFFTRDLPDQEAASDRGLQEAEVLPRT